MLPLAGLQSPLSCAFRSGWAKFRESLPSTFEQQIGLDHARGGRPGDSVDLGPPRENIPAPVPRCGFPGRLPLGTWITYAAFDTITCPSLNVPSLTEHR